MENEINLNIEGTIKSSKLEKDLTFLKEVPLFLETSSEKDVKLDAFLYKGDRKKTIHLYPKCAPISGCRILTKLPEGCEIKVYPKSMHILRKNKDNSDIIETFYVVFYEPKKD